MKFVTRIIPQTYKANYKVSAIRAATSGASFTIGTYGVYYSSLNKRRDGDDVIVIRVEKRRKKTIQKKVPNKKGLAFVSNTGEKIVPQMITKSTITQKKEWIVKKYRIPVMLLKINNLKVEMNSAHTNFKILPNK